MKTSLFNRTLQTQHAGFGGSFLRTMVLCGGLAGFLTGCAVVPDALRAETVEVPVPTVAEVQRTFSETFQGREVVWGGVIMNVRNHAQGTTLEIVSRPLARDFRPRQADQSDGRFRAHTSQFLEPATYSTGREVTVRGPITGLTEGTVGEYPYRFPEVTAEGIHLWPEPPPPPPVYWRDPFWDPWWPWGRSF